MKSHPIPRATWQFHYDVPQSNCYSTFLSLLCYATSSVAQEHSMEQFWIFPMTAPTLHFWGEIGQLIGRCVQSETPAERWIQRSSLSQIRSSPFPLFNTLEHVYVHLPRHLRPSTYAKDLVLCRQWVQHVARASQELAGEGAPEVLLALQNISFLGTTAIETCRGSDSEVHCRATALRSSCGCPLVMRGLVANVLG